MTEYNDSLLRDDVGEPRRKLTHGRLREWLSDCADPGSIAAELLQRRAEVRRLRRALKEMERLWATKYPAFTRFVTTKPAAPRG